MKFKYLKSQVTKILVYVSAAVYLVEYARRGNRFVKLVRLTTETLTGIPSIIFRLFGMLLFVGFFRWGYSLLAGSCTVAIMILPTIMRTTEEAFGSGFLPRGKFWSWRGKAAPGF